MNQTDNIKYLHDQKNLLINLIERPTVNNDLRINYMLYLRQVLRDIRTLDPESLDLPPEKIAHLTNIIKSHSSEQIHLLSHPPAEPKIQEKKCGCFNFFQR